MELNTKLKRRSLIAAGATAVVGLGAAATWWLRRPQPPVSIKAARFQGDLPATDPDHAAWKGAPATALKPVPQQMYYPRLAQPTISDLSVKALFNGQAVAFQCEWKDNASDDLESIVRFRDAVAVMLPFSFNPEERPPIFMGMAGRPVYILQWKASWQRDVEKGFQGVEVAYPRWFNDVYPGQDTLTKLGMTPETAQTFYPGLVAGNILSQQTRKSPVEEAVAEGFGTLTSLKEQRAMGKGTFAGGRWKVSLAMPNGGTDVPALKAGLKLPVAFAVWDGGKRQVGGRKHYVDWVELSLPGG